VFVLNSLDATISVIDPATWTETAHSHRQGAAPPVPDAGREVLIVANALGDSLTFVDPRTAEVQRTVRDIVDPTTCAFRRT
jgi:DNA-binding beta-propeller fold protein YncE